MLKSGDLKRVEAQIRAAFAGVAYPGDGCLTNSREGTEPALLEAEFKGKSDWRTLDPSFIDQAPDGFGAALTHGLDRESRDQRINPRRYGERTWFEYARYKFAIFNVEEAAAIVSYLGCKLGDGAVTEYEKERIDEALESYWATRG